MNPVRVGVIGIGNMGWHHARVLSLIKDAELVGVADPDRGQIVQAFVVLKAGHAPQAELALALQEHVKATLAPFKYPRKVVFLEALPRTETGKLQRFKLRQMT